MSRSSPGRRSSGRVARIAIRPGESTRHRIIYRHPELFRLLRVAAEDDHADQRWAVDTPEDFALVERIYDAIGRDDFGWREALAVVEAHPSWVSINRHVTQKVVPPAGERS